MARILSSHNINAARLSGRLGDALVDHTKQRMRFFFCYLYVYRILMHILKVPANEWGRHISVKATHQCDSGLRREEGWDVQFKKDDSSILEYMASEFKRVDAAHFCNLGLKPSLAGLCNASDDARATDLFNQLESICAATRQMPQRINIGPDRVVDRVHGVMCLDMVQQMGQGRAAVSPAFIEHYKKIATQEMIRYAAGQRDVGNVAVADAAMIYVATWGENVAPTELRSNGAASKVIQSRKTHTNAVLSTVSTYAYADFYALGLRDDPTADISMVVSTRAA